MNKKQIMNWVWDHPLTVTVIVALPTFALVIWAALKTHII